MYPHIIALKRTHHLCGSNIKPQHNHEKNITQTQVEGHSPKHPANTILKFQGPKSQGKTEVQSQTGGH